MKTHIVDTRNRLIAAPINLQKSSTYLAFVNNVANYVTVRMLIKILFILIQCF
jgi:hypothetical protein